MFNFNSKNIRKNTGVFIVNFKQISHLILVFLLVTLTCSLQDFRPSRIPSNCCIKFPCSTIGGSKMKQFRYIKCFSLVSLTSLLKQLLKVVFHKFTWTNLEYFVTIICHIYFVIFICFE